MAEVGSRREPEEVGEISVATIAVERCESTRNTKFDETGQETSAYDRHRLE